MIRAYTLNRVRDHITVKEGKDILKLDVDCDAKSIVTRIMAAKKQLDAIDGESTQEEREAAARAFSDAIFGNEGTQRLFDFYNGNADCVVTICGMYFASGLGKKITRAQKRIK